jgi:AmiR/NasT family two-component response regulator
MVAVQPEEDTIRSLRAEIAQLLADAVRVGQEAQVETERVRRVHDDAMSTAQAAFDDAMQEAETNTQRALESRDLIGQAKGIIMVTMHCDADRAFQLLVRQSQAENRKLVDVARAIASSVSRRAAG